MTGKDDRNNDHHTLCQKRIEITAKPLTEKVRDTELRHLSQRLFRGPQKAHKDCGVDGLEVSNGITDTRGSSVGAWEGRVGGATSDEPAERTVSGHLPVMAQLGVELVFLGGFGRRRRRSMGRGMEYDRELGAVGIELLSGREGGGSGTVTLVTAAGYDCVVPRPPA
ncbi:hypothetical protein BaRGS_00023435, partial [Batillaria attramentaria]